MSDLLAGPQTGSAESRLTERAGSRAMPASAASLRGTFAHFLGKAKVYTWNWLSGAATRPPLLSAEKNTRVTPVLSKSTKAREVAKLVLLSVTRDWDLRA